MRTSVERWRIGLLVGAALLVVVLAAFLGYARYKVRHTLANLPGRMGATITKEFDGYTYSQSDGKRTIFTIHAGKAVQHTDGTYTLHDVKMILYGKMGDRADRISGDDFEYDTKAEEVRAAGIVHIDIEAPAAQSAPDSDARKHLAGPAAGEVENGDAADSRVIHVKTSGLVYLKKLGIAATSQDVDFMFGGFTGHSLGAEYNSDTGHLVLQSAITVSGVDKGRPVAMNAAHGELDRATSLAEFLDAHYSSSGESGQAHAAHIHLRTDGSVERIEGDGNVVLAEAGRGTATSDRANIALDTTNKPKSAVLTGSVHLAEDDPLRQVRGESDTAHLDFDNQGNLDHASLQSNVRTSERLPEPVPGPDASAKSFQERQRLQERAPWQERTLTADELDLFLAMGAEQKPLLRDAKATGSVHLTTVVTVSKPEGPKVCGKQPIASGRCFVTTTTRLSGDTIMAHFIAPHGDAELSTVHGTGRTSREQHTSSGVDEITSGDTMDAIFREVPGAVVAAKSAVELATAVQQGNVVITRSSPAKSRDGSPAGPDVQHATARMAAYDADAGTVTLTGNVRMSETGSTLTADRVVMERDTQNATADGAIKATYLQAPPQKTNCAQKSSSGEPVHILAARAEFSHDDSRATFYGQPNSGGPGSNSGLARMWQAVDAGQGGVQNAQGGSQIEAPVIVFQKEQVKQGGKEYWRLTARAERAGTAGQVHAALPYVEKVKSSEASVKDEGMALVKQDAKGKPMPARQEIAHITSSQMVYSDLDRQALFTGGVRLLDRQGDLRAQQATVFLTAASAGNNPASKQGKPATNGSNEAVGGAPCPSGTDSAAFAGAAELLGGNVERVVATQTIEITQPGVKATGDRLVYTASDQMFLLTGTSTAPPKVVDAQQGTTTGAALRFHAGDHNVEVSGKDGDAPARRVHTETRVKE